MLKISRTLLIFQVRYFCQQPAQTASTLSSRFFEYLGGNKKKIEIQENELSKQLNKASNSNKLFQILDGAFKENSNIQLNRTKFFNDAISRLTQNLRISFNQENFVKLCFYVSFYKKNDPGPKIVKSLFDEFLDKATHLTSLDVAIICLTSYKASVRVQNEKFLHKVIEEFSKVDESDEFLLVAFLKCLRFNKMKSDKILWKLRKLDYSKHDYQSLIHIIPYIADNGIVDHELSKKIVSRCIETFDSWARVKDIQKMLHSCATLNLKIKSEDLEAIEGMIVTAIKSTEYKSHFDHFINAALSLWILDYKCMELVKILLNDQRFYATGPYSRIKLDSRKILLSTCIEIECPELMNQKLKFSSFDEARKPPGYLIKPSLEKVMTQRFISNKKVQFVQQIINLNIAGIMLTSQEGKRTHFEVLDVLTTLEDKKTPNGLFELKLRLLKKMSCNVKVINSFDSS